MRALYITLMICCAYAGRSFALDTVRVNPSFAVYISPLGLIPVAYTIGPGIGLEIKLYKRVAVTAEYSYLFTSGYAVKGSVKCYLEGFISDNKKEIIPYLAAEYGYKQQRYNVTDYKYKTGTSEISDIAVDYAVDKTVNIFNLKIGYISRRPGSKLFHSFYSDMYAGIGIRHRIVHNDLAASTEDLYHWNEGFIDNFSNSENKGFRLSLSLGVKFGYRYH